MDRLTAADLTRMRAEHVPYNPYPHIDITVCHGHGLWKLEIWPCDAALLLNQFSPGPVLDMSGIAVGLFGPSTAEELPDAPRP